jgi:hypothetical protein
MRLSDAGLRRHPTKLVYLNHRPPPWPNEDAPRDRSNRLLDDTQRSRDRAHRSCNSLRLPQLHRPKPFANRFAQFYGNQRFRETPDRLCELKGRLGMLRRLCATASPNEVVLIRLRSEHQAAPLRHASRGASERRSGRRTQTISRLPHVV